jgi:hypothetical protein
VFVADELFEAGGDVGDAERAELLVVRAGEHHSLPSRCCALSLGFSLSR